jgi:TolB-like protein
LTHEHQRIPLDSLALLGGAFADGVARRLASLPGLRVIPPERTQAMEDGDASPEEMGRALHVTCVGVCSLKEGEAGLDLRVELIDTLAERLVAEERFLAAVSETAVLERQAARWIMQELLGPFTSNSHR